MEKAIKFLGICLLLSAIVISLSLFIPNYLKLKIPPEKESRYSFSAGEGICVLDKETGDVYIYQLVQGSTNSTYEFKKHSLPK